jgi:heme-degrading monooxygenase HmoA
MYARVWKVAVAPENLNAFTAACNNTSGVVRKHRGFRGAMVIRGGPKDVPECTIISVWDSLENLRDSENEAFQKSVAGILACCKPGTVLQEEDVLICDFGADGKVKTTKPAKRIAKTARAKRRVSRRAS